MNKRAMLKAKEIKSYSRRNRASKPSQLFSKTFPLIPPCMHGRDLAARGIVTVEYEDIVDHGVDLRERYLILPWPQVWRNVEKLHIRIRLVRGVQNCELVVDQEPYMARYLLPWDRPDIFEPVLAARSLLGCIRLKVLNRVAGERYAFRLRNV